MNIQERIALAPFTTLRLGGPARFFIEAQTEKEIEEAIAHAHERTMSLFVLGAGSNLLVPDAGVEGVVLKITSRDITFEQDGDGTLLIADAGVPWEKIVDAASDRDLFGIENLAGIPGTMGGASVQNIGAYGAELADAFAYADCIDSITGAHRRIAQAEAEAEFAYRASFFKMHRELVIVRVALRLSKNALPNIAYPDLARANVFGTPLDAPRKIAHVVRAIRANKFPHAEKSAGSFFKNPVVSCDLARSLRKRFPGLPLFPQEDDAIKVSLAWLLDHALSLKGFSMGRVRLYEKQPLVVVARDGATAADVNALADEVAKRVFDATGIEIEREVETFGVR